VRPLGLRPLGRCAPVSGGGLRNPADYPDREQVWRTIQRRRRFGDAAELITPEVIAEHAANPRGRRPHFHSLPLQQILTCLRAEPPRARYELLATAGAFELIAIERGRPPTIVPGVRHASFDEALHALFLRRVAELRAVLAGEYAD
jgi:hypothetical protein